MKKTINYFHQEDNFLGFLVYSDSEGYQFGYDADLDNPSYAVHSFKSESQAMAYIAEHYPNYR